MPYKVKATVIDIMGDQEKFPCHFLHKIGDEAIFDGESWTGRLCPDLWPGVTEKGAMLFHAGPRYAPHMTYSIVGIHGNKQCDPSNEIFDGRGFKSAFEPYDLPKIPHGTVVRWRTEVAATQAKNCQTREGNVSRP
jgi:uncharacterized repeat protein (TIGR04076 family)